MEKFDSRGEREEKILRVKDDMFMFAASVASAGILVGMGVNRVLAGMAADETTTPTHVANWVSLAAFAAVDTFFIKLARNSAHDILKQFNDSEIQ